MCVVIIFLWHKIIVAMVAAEKTVGPATVVTFLGVEVDTVEMELRLPLKKLEKLKELVAL